MRSHDTKLSNLLTTLAATGLAGTLTFSIYLIFAQTL